MAKWRPRISPDVEAALAALGPYEVVQGGLLRWEPAPGSSWPWGETRLMFGVDDRNARDPDYLRLLDAWRQVASRREEVVAAVRDAVLQSWAWALESLTAEDRAEMEEDAAGRGEDPPFRYVGGCGFELRTRAPGQVAATAYVRTAWDDEHGVEVDLIDPDFRASWSFL